jgi:hypothetical protein
MPIIHFLLALSLATSLTTLWRLENTKLIGFIIDNPGFGLSNSSDTVQTIENLSCIVDGNFKVTIRTFYLKGVETNDKRVFNPPAYNQIITFFMNDSILKTVTPYSFYVFVKTNKGTRVKIMDNTVVSIKIYKKNNQLFYYLSGYGGCNTCSEYYALYDKSGKRLSERYFTQKKNYINFGKDASDLLSSFGIDQNTWEKEATVGVQ